MKRCPSCNRVETDDALVFCRVDGTDLIRDSSSLNSEAGTAKLASTATESKTSIFPNPTDNAVNRATAPRAMPPAASTGTTGALAQQKSRRTATTIAVILIALVAVAGFGLYKFVNRSQSRKAISFASAKITRLTNSGKVGAASISPDGKYVAYSSFDESSQSSLWVRHV